MKHRIIALALIALIIAAHVALWSSDRMPDDIKLRLTVINAIGWSIVLIPAFLVGKWAAAHKGRAAPFPPRRPPVKEPANPMTAEDAR